MSFLKQISNGGKYLVHQANVGLHRLDHAVNGFGRIVHTAHHGYQDLKRYSTTILPPTKLLFNLAESSPEGLLINSTRKRIESNLDTAHVGLGAAKYVTNSLNQGIQNPVLSNFIRT